jgi:HSP20 family protein
MSKRETKDVTTNRELQTPQRAHQVMTPFDGMDRWFDQVFPRNWMQPLFRMGWPDLEAPWVNKMFRVDVIDRDAEVVVRAELPGVSKDELDVSLSDNTLTIRTHSHHETTEEQGHYHRREISAGELQRTLRLPFEVDGDQTKATFKDGVLELIAPKLEGTSRHSIKIE